MRSFVLQPMQQKSKTVIIIGGPTASGKTGLAIQLAQRLGTEIISADSRQCYTEMNIGVARPSPEELAAVKQYFIASHSIHQKVNAATFEAYALEKANHLFRTHNTVVMVGGTGLYLKAFTDGMDAIPEVPEAIRNSIIEDYNKLGLEWLQQQVAEADPQFYATGEIKNPHRLMRALEVYRATGKSILTFRKGSKAERPFRIIKIALQLPKEQLHNNINRRVDKMMNVGLLDEVKSLLPYRHLGPLQTVGYTELFDYLEGTKTLHAAVEDIKKNTRQYAKRQLTWFRKDKDFIWFDAGAIEPVWEFVQQQNV